MKYIPIIKTVLKGITSVATSMLVSNATNRLVNPNDKPLRKIGVAIGGMIIGEMVSEKACEFVEAKFDSTFNTLKNLNNSAEAEEE